MNMNNPANASGDAYEHFIMTLVAVKIITVQSDFS